MDLQDNKTTENIQESSEEILPKQEDDLFDTNSSHDNDQLKDSISTLKKKKTKSSKKSAKLDAKSKLEKSRQSARECRARKKLRYQYLEDLVNGREKAVVKLREELSMVSTSS